MSWKTSGLVFFWLLTAIGLLYAGNKRKKEKVREAAVAASIS